MGYIRPMIKSFKSKGLERFWTKGDASKLSVQNVARVRRMLESIGAATRAEDLNVAGYFFHRLQGTDRFSVRVTGNWRITFGWADDGAIELDLEDYH